MEKNYIFIRFTEKGFSRIENLTRAGVEKKIKDIEEDYPNEDISNNFVQFTRLAGGDSSVINSEYLPEHRRYMIIEGEVIVPEPVSSVIEYKLPDVKQGKL